MKRKLNLSVLYRLIAIVFLTAGAVRLILLKPAPSVEQLPKTEKDIVALSDSIDTGIDSLYRLFTIEPRNIRRREISASGTAIRRREHRVQVPPAFVALLFNQKLNQLAEKFGGNAYGSENTKTKTITLHARIDEHITHSIAFRRIEEQAKKSVRNNKRK